MVIENINSTVTPLDKSQLYYANDVSAISTNVELITDPFIDIGRSILLSETANVIVSNTPFSVDKNLIDNIINIGVSATLTETSVISTANESQVATILSEFPSLSIVSTVTLDDKSQFYYANDVQNIITTAFENELYLNVDATTTETANIITANETQVVSRSYIGGDLFIIASFDITLSETASVIASNEIANTVLGFWLDIQAAITNVDKSQLLYASDIVDVLSSISFERGSDWIEKVNQAITWTEIN